MTTLEEQQANQIENLRKQLAREKLNNETALSRVRTVLDYIRAANATLQVTECAMSGVPEPKRGE